MSLLHRWSLPSRGFIRNKSQDDESSSLNPYSTIQVCQPGLRRRANISSAFSTLFEKNENQRSTTPDRRDSGADDSPLLELSSENIPRKPRARKFLDSPELDTTASLRQRLGPNASKHADIGRTEHSQNIWRELVKQAWNNRNERATIRVPSSSDSESNQPETKDKKDRPNPKKSNIILERIRSTSSSYPSEGLRSSEDRNCSPVPRTRSNGFGAKYFRYGKYPSRSSWRFTSMPVSEASTSTPLMGMPRCRASRVSSETMASTSMASPTLTAQTTNQEEISPFADPPETQMQTSRKCSTVSMKSRRASGMVHGGKHVQELSSFSEIDVPILENENATSSQLEVRFMSYKKPKKTQSTCEEEEDEAPPRISITDWTSGPCHRVNTNKTALTAIRHPSLIETDDAWSTIYDTGAKPLSHRVSWMQLFSLSHSNGSSQTITQRLQNFKLRKWVKKVCFRTKARFELVGKPVKLVAMQTPRDMWRRKKMNVKKRVARRKLTKINKHTKIKYQPWYSAHMELIEEPTVKKSLADRIMGTLQRKSLQLGFQRPEKPKKRSPVRVAHLRSNSCPAEIGREAFVFSNIVCEKGYVAKRMKREWKRDGRLFRV